MKLLSIIFDDIHRACNILLVLFIVFKLTGVLDWSWLWILSPLWMPIAAIILASFGFVVWVKLFK